jgi:hypothetical protein
MRFVACSLVLAAAVGSARADGDSLVDTLGPREVALGDAMRAGATGASAIALNPAGLPLSREMVFEGGYGYRPSDGASLFGVSACDTTGTAGCFFYNYAGANPTLDGMTGHTNTNVGGLTLAYPFTPRVIFGSTIKYFKFDSDMPMQPSSSGFAWDAGALLRLTDMINIGFAGYNIAGAQSTQFPRAIGGGLQAKVLPILSVNFDARWRLEGAQQGARFGGGAELFLSTKNGQTGFPIRLGALHDNDLGSTFLSAGLGVSAMKWGFDIAARRAVTNGDELLVIASMRFYGPRLPAPPLDSR